MRETVGEERKGELSKVFESNSNQTPWEGSGLQFILPNKEGPGLLSVFPSQESPGMHSFPAHYKTIHTCYLTVSVVQDLGTA